MKIGEMVKVFLKNKIVKEGLLIKSTKDTLTLKLNNGYNIGIKKENIQKISLVKAIQKEIKKLKIKQNPNLPRVLILHTGGTIASKVSYSTGGVVPKFTPEDLLEIYPELTALAHIDSKLICNLFSEDMNFSYINKLAAEIKKAKNYRGIIVTHGTDTLAYTASALAFMFEKINIPVVLVGAQRSSDRGSSDAALNLLSSIKFIIKTNFTGIAICMHLNSSDDSCVILPPLQTKKFHTSRRDAFKQVNDEPIVIIEDNNIKQTSKFFPEVELKLSLLNPNLKIGILKSHPNLHKDEIKAYSKMHGLILEGTGMGHFPINENKSILNEIKKLAKKMPVVMVSQCIFGRVNMDVYETGRKLLEIGILGNLTNMTTEAAYMKLAYLLSTKQKKELMNENLRGEITQRSRYKEDFLD